MAKKVTNTDVNSTAGTGQTAPADAGGQSRFLSKAEELFEAYPAARKFYFTADGQAFFVESDARNHAGSLKDQAIETIEK
jgi:hypothetical protein